jgi:hypothetical protein
VVKGPDGNEIISAEMLEETPGSGIYIYEAPWTLKEQNLPKGIYLVHAQAVVSPAENAVDMIQFHIDPPGEFEPSFLGIAGLGCLVAMVFGLTGFHLRQRNFRD